MVLKHRFEGIIYDREINYSDKVFSYYQNRVIEWGEYESSFQKAISYRSNLDNEDKLSQNEIETAISKLPPFVKSDGFRDDVINFFDWHLLTRWRTIDSLTQGNHIINYCSLVNSTATQREDNLVCTYRFTYQNAIDWINKNKDTIQFDIEILKELANSNGKLLGMLPLN